MMFFFHLRLAFKSLRRTPLYTFTCVLGLALGIAVFVTARSVVLMAWKAPLPAMPGLFHVELERRSSFDDLPFQARYGNVPRMVSLLLPWRDAEILLRSRLPERQTATFNTKVLVAGANGRPAPVRTRFCSRDFFEMFDVAFVAGGPWAGEDDGGVVVSERAARAYFGDEPAVGRTLRVEGVDRTVRGVTAEPRAARIYDLGLYTSPPEELFLPYSYAGRLEPEAEFAIAADRVTAGPLAESESSMVLLWVQLPDASRRAEYEEELRAFVAAQAHDSTRIAPARAFALRGVAQWMDEVISVRGAFEVWMMGAWFVLATCTFNAARMLLAKNLSRASDSGIHRVFGATRWTIFFQHFLEALLLGLAAAFVGLVLAMIAFPLLQLSVPEIQIEFALDPGSILATFVTALGCAGVAGLFPAWRVSGIRPAAYSRRT